MQIAKTILKQIGNQALMLVGAKNFVGTENGVKFRIGRNTNGVNVINITLDNDLYNIDFAYQRGTSYKVKKQYTGVYCDMLLDIIESGTGLFVSFYQRQP